MSGTHSQTPQHWETLSEKLIAPCRIFDVFSRHCRHPSGKEGDFFVLKLSNWALALPLTSNNELVLVHQYRFGADLLSWEVPGGILNPNEDPINTAVRELEEETGFTGHNPKIIGSCLPNPAILTNRGFFILIENCTKTHQTSWDHHEELETKLVPINEVWDMVRSGKIQNGVTLNALFALKLHLEI